MANKASFTPDEWSRIVGSPMVVGMAVTASDPSGLWGMLKEGMAGGWAMLQARQDPQANELIKAVAGDFATAETRDATRNALQAKFKVKDIAEIKTKAIEELRAVSALLDAKAAGDAAAFKGWLRDIAQKAAEAGRAVVRMPRAVARMPGAMARRRESRCMEVSCLAGVAARAAPSVPLRWRARRRTATRCSSTRTRTRSTRRSTRSCPTTR